jgi:hypothetical protein
MAKISSWEAISFRSSKETTRNFWKTKGDYGIHKTPAICSCSEPDWSIPYPPVYFFEINFDVIFVYTQQSSRRSPSLRFHHQYSVHSPRLRLLYTVPYFIIIYFNPLTPELNPSAQRCLTRIFTGDFASWTVHFVNMCVKNQQIHQLFIQFINYVW